MTRRRRPIVSSDGETRSKGSVSQAGNSSTAASGPKYRARSWATRSASAAVGTATRTGRRVVTRVSAARYSARAGSGTATIGARSMTARTAGSSARSAGSSVNASEVAVSIVLMAFAFVCRGARKAPPTGADRGSRALSEGTARPRPPSPPASGQKHRAERQFRTQRRDRSASRTAERRPEPVELPRRSPHLGVGADRVPVGQRPIVAGLGPGLVGRPGRGERDGERRGGVTVAARDEVQHLQLEQGVVEGARGAVGLAASATGKAGRQEPEPVGEALGAPVVGRCRGRAAAHEAAGVDGGESDRKSTRLNSSHLGISYAVFCL